MMTRAIEQLITWQPGKIQEYCKKISQNTVQQLRALDCFIEDDGYRSHHLFGIYLPENIPLEEIKAILKRENIIVSYRGNAIRISCNVYNTETDFEKLAVHFS